MDFLAVLQEASRLLVHAPSGKPRVLSSAIGRSVAVSAMAVRCLAPAYSLDRLPYALLVACWALLSISSAGVILELTGLGALHIGTLPHLVLQVIYSAGFITFSLPIFRHLSYIGYNGYK